MGDLQREQSVFLLLTKLSGRPLAFDIKDGVFPLGLVIT
jgi:hypothetical protein